jgi:hypothetical protein
MNMEGAVDCEFGRDLDVFEENAPPVPFHLPQISHDLKTFLAPQVVYFSY